MHMVRTLQPEGCTPTTCIAIAVVEHQGRFLIGQRPDGVPLARLWEFPSSVACIGKANIPVSGGGYFRLLPYSVSSRLLRRINRSNGDCPNFSESPRKNGTVPLSPSETTSNQSQPFIFYTHPWEIDPDQPRVPVSALTRVRHYRGLRQTLPRIERLLAEFRFGAIGSALAADPTVAAAGTVA